jgi:Fe-S cluster assembly scaffold protein SufB
MAIHSFLKAEKGDPDWAFSPEQYFGKEFKIIDASTIEIAEGIKDLMVLRQDPTDKNLLAKHIKITSKPESHLDLVIINDADDKLQQIFLYDIHLQRDSIINFGIFAKGGKFNKHIIQVSIEEGAHFSVFGLMTNDVGGDTEIITKVIHQHNNTHSRQFILGKAGNGSQTVFQSIVVLDDGSEGSVASVESANLITGEKGRCYSKPEVYDNCENVKSSIGKITQHLDAEKIYYLQSRGLSIKKAVQTVVNGFQNQATSIVNYDDLKEEIQQIFNI